MTIETATYKLEIAGRDVTRDLAPYVLDVTYTDRVDGASDELEVRLEDTYGRFRAAWYPTKGDRVKAWLGFPSGLIPCGTFEIDQPTYEGPPDVLTIRALAASPSKPVRTKNNAEHEGKTLAQIAQAVGGRLGLRIVGDVPNLKLDSVTQSNETDLAFLSRLAKDYGLVFSLRGDAIVFQDVYALEAGRSILTLDRADLTRYAFSENMVGVYKSCELTYHQPKTKRKVTHTVTATAPGIAGGDVLKIRKKASGESQAMAMARAELHRANAKRKTGRVELAGDPRLLAGVNFSLTGLGVYSGKWHALETAHRVDRSGGYGLEAEIKEV